jgi:hypothetical protein
VKARAVLGSLRFRLFLTAWILFALMFATNVVREHYPALALVEDGTYRLDRYHELHSDIFEHQGHWYVNNNVGTSVLAAIPLLPFRPLLAALDARSREALARGGAVDTSFDTRYPNRERFYRLVRQNGWELKFGALAAITAALFMAPLSALFVLLTFDFLAGRGVAAGRSAALAMLFGFATPVLFRTAHLNHNMMVMYATFGSFLALAPAKGLEAMLPRAGTGRSFAAGVLAGAAVMCDYSGVIPLAWLFAWTVAGAARSRERGALRGPAAFAAGAAIPVLVQLHSQWASFGSWIHPPQTWMAQANFTDRGYRGFDWPALDLFVDNLIEPRWGLFAYGPLLVLGLVPPRRGDASAPLPFRAWVAAMAFSFTFMLFAAANQYGRMQWNTGVRYLMPVVPFFFLAAANHLVRLRGAWLAAAGGAAAVHAWVVSMRRVVSLGTESVQGVFEDWRRFLEEGPRLPWLDVLSRTATGRGSVPAGSAAHVAVIAGCLLLIVLLWWAGRRLSRSAATTTTR